MSGTARTRTTRKARGLHPREAAGAFRRALRNLVQDPLLSAVSCGILAATLLVLGTLVVVIIQSSRLAAAIAPSDEANVYLAAPLAPRDRKAMLARIEALAGVDATRYVGPEEALDELAHDVPQWREWIQELGQNPLPATIVVTLADSRGATIEPTLAALRALDGVVEVQAPGSFATSLLRFLRAARWSAVGLGAALLAALLFIVVATLRLALHARASEIEILRYAGATERWVRLPLWIEGALLGAVAGLLAWGLATGVASGMGAIELPPLLTGPSLETSIELVPLGARLSLLVLGPLVGGAGAAVAVRWGLGKA